MRSRYVLILACVEFDLYLQDFGLNYYLLDLVCCPIPTNPPTFCGRGHCPSPTPLSAKLKLVHTKVKLKIPKRLEGLSSVSASAPYKAMNLVFINIVEEGENISYVIFYGNEPVIRCLMTAMLLHDQDQTLRDVFACES
jgi:hypothetical protein